MREPGARSCPRCSTMLLTSPAVCRSCRLVSSDTGDLRHADLRGLVLTEADFCGADLSGADLSGTNADRADLRGCNLNGTLLTATSLHRAHVDLLYAPLMRGYDGAPAWSTPETRMAEARVVAMPAFRLANGFPMSCPYCRSPDFAFSRQHDLAGAYAVTCLGCRHLTWFAHYVPNA